MEVHPINFPLLQHLPSITALHIQDDKYVLSLDGISDRDVTDIQLAFFSMMGSDSGKNKYYYLDYITDKIKPLYKHLNYHDVIIAPGDSPAKFINVFRLCGFDVSKFIQFPVSGLGEPEGISSELQGKLDDYIALVLQNVNITSTTKVCIFDYISSGASVKYITKSLNKLFPVTKIRIVSIPEDQRATNEKQYRIFKGLMIEGEIYGSRAVRYYPVSSFKGILPPLEQPNLWKCNLICMTVALNYLGRLEEIGDNNPQTLIVSNKDYKCSYFDFDFESEEIKHCVFIQNEYDLDIGYTFDLGATKLEDYYDRSKIKMFSILQLTKL